MKSPETLLAKNLIYLGLNPSFRFNLGKSPKNPAKHIRYGYMINIMQSFTSMMIELKQSKTLSYLRRAGLKDFIFRLISKPNKYPEMDGEDREFLKEIYRHDINILENLTDIDLGIWK